MATGQAMDSVPAAMADAVPRAEVLSRALDRLARSVRRSVALRRRMEAGRPRAGSAEGQPGRAGADDTQADDRRPIVRRQLARKVGEAIGRAFDGEAAERLFDELAEQLEDLGLDEDLGALPVDTLVRRICRELGLTMDGVQEAVGWVARGGEMVDADTG